jgi:tetratricopeptide (TPR) repeat protein
MRILYLTGSPGTYMRPPSLSDEMLVAGPDWTDALDEKGKIVSLKTQIGKFSVKTVISKIPPEQSPDVLVCLVDATKRCLPQDLACFSGPKILLLADTHHLQAPLSSLLSYAGAEPFDRIILLYDRHHAGFFYAAGFKNLFWFPGLTFPHSDSWVLESQKVRSRSASIGFVGQAAAHHPRRKRILEAIQRAGLPLLQKSIPQSESLAFYASSLLGLNASLNGDLNLRFFEVISSGSLLITDSLAPDSGLGCFSLMGCAFEEYRNEQELVEKARYFLGHPREAFELAKKGQAWFQSHFKEDMRRAMFQKIALDGIQPEIFPMPPQEKTFYFKRPEDMAEATIVYESIQELHRIKEVVRIGYFGTLSQGIRQMFDTLPRIQILETSPEPECDLIIGEPKDAVEILAIKPSSAWFPSMQGKDISQLTAMFSKSGYSLFESSEAFFCLPGDSHESLAEVETLCKEAAHFFQCGDIGKSFDLARRAFGMNQRSVTAAKLMAEALLKIGYRGADAKKLLLHALGLDFEDTEIRPALAEACLQAGQIDTAMDWIRESIARKPEHLRAMRVLANIHKAVDDLASALETLELAVSTHPNCLETKYEYAMLLRKSGKLQEGLNIQLQLVGAKDLPNVDPPKKAIRVAFLVQHPQGWTNFESVREAMLEDSRFEVLVIAAPYLHPYPPEGGPEAIYAFLEKRGVSHQRWDSGVLKPNFADVLFIQNPYEVTRPPALRIGSLMKLVPRLAYIPYGLEIGGGKENAANQYNLPLQQRAWMVFARSERQKDLFSIHCASGNSHIAVTGHPKIDPIKNLKKNMDEELLAFAGDRKVFLWNPQFDIRPDGTGFSTFLIWNEFFMKEFQRRQDSCLIIRPHPLFFGTLEARKIWDSQQIERFLRECQNAPNILIDRRPSYLPVFAASSALISDASSFLLEYAATGKPVLYLPNRRGPQLNSDGEFVEKHCQIGETEEQIRRFLDDVALGIDRNAHSRMEAYKSFMHFSKIGAGHEIKSEILRRLREEFELQNSMPISR